MRLRNALKLSAGFGDVCRDPVVEQRYREARRREGLRARFSLRIHDRSEEADQSRMRHSVCQGWFSAGDFVRERRNLLADHGHDSVERAKRPAPAIRRADSYRQW